MAEFIFTPWYGPMRTEWLVPAGYVASREDDCRACDQRILWCKTPAGKWSPQNPDGTSHFSNCPGADKFRGRKP